MHPDKIEIKLLAFSDLVVPYGGVVTLSPSKKELDCIKNTSFLYIEKIEE